MNIYIAVEISVRELDSSLLLATLAASKGHQVIVSDLESITKGIESGLLSPGIFHAKSLTPADHKIARHKAMIDKGFMITSLDEEGGLDISGYEEFSKRRYSEKTIAQSSAVFGWGSEDVETLKQVYPKHTSKIHMTGSPRADLWKSLFKEYWGTPQSAPVKPFLLVSSNMGLANNTIPFYKVIKSKKESGYYQRDPKMFKKDMGRIGEDYLRTSAFIEAIQYLAVNNNGYDIVLRPHPTEDIEAWKFYLKDIPNVHVIREGSISAWVNNAFAIIHNRCTTALEATISKKPVVTYIPYKNMLYSDAPSNKVGYRVELQEDLLLIINKIFDDIKLGDQKNEIEQIPEVVSKKIYIDNNQLSAEKIVKVWDNLNNNDTRPSNLKMFKWLLKAYKFRKMIGKVRRVLIGRFGHHNDNNKFPLLKSDDIYKRVIRLQNILKIDGIKCELLSDRTILIKRQ